MIEWLTVLQVAVAVVGGVLCLALGFAGKKPNDYTLGVVALVEVLLVVQLVSAIVSPFAGNSPSGDPLEFYTYLVSALLLPAAGVFWALVERTRWSTVVLGVVCLAIAVMVYRMNVIWFVQGA